MQLPTISLVAALTALGATPVASRMGQVRGATMATASMQDAGPFRSRAAVVLLLTGVPPHGHEVRSANLRVLGR